jgi:uncharacterized protein YbjQ (UPF0145 family)
MNGAYIYAQLPNFTCSNGRLFLNFSPLYMLVTTTSTIEGKHITNYIGLVNGEAIIGANLVKDFFTSIRDVVGGHSGAYVQALREAKSIALKEMVDQATRLGANAVIGVDLDYQTIGGNGAMLMVSANGTAVIVV